MSKRSLETEGLNSTKKIMQDELKIGVIRQTLYVLKGKDVVVSENIAAFDMDGTLITTISGSKFPESTKDWKWLYNNVKSTLKTLHSEGFKIVVFTNQAGISNGKQKIQDLKIKISDMLSELEIPVEFYLSSAYDSFRKPNVDAWKEMIEKMNENTQANLQNSFFVGDAAGRPKDWAINKKKDHSVADRKFASNLGLKFLTPEEYFLNEESAPFSWRSINPSEILEKCKQDELVNNELISNFTKSLGLKQEVILMVGFPASGKSFFVKKVLVPKSYIIISQDEDTKPKCIKKLKEALLFGKSAVIDNTNPNKKSRSEYIFICKSLNIQIRLVWIQTDMELSLHNNFYREKLTKNKAVPLVAFNTFKSRFDEPQIEEGLVEIIKIPWVPDFENDAEKKLFVQWTE